MALSINSALGAFNLDDIQVTYLILFSALMTVFLIISFFFLIYISCYRDSFLLPLEDDSHFIPDSLEPPQENDLNNIQEDLKSLYHGLDYKDKIRFKLGLKFFEQNKPDLAFNAAFGEIDTSYLLIRDRGISCFYFENYQEQLSELIQNVEDEEIEQVVEEEEQQQQPQQSDSQETDILLVTETTSLLPVAVKKKYSSTNVASSTTSEELDYRSLMFKNVPFFVEDLTDISFVTNEMSSTTLNMPLPLKNRKNDTVYFETKLFDFNPQTTLISIGLTTSPYPNFQLPGLAPYSIGIQTDGSLRLSGRPFLNDLDLPVILPQLIEGDVIGVGYKTGSGSVFITHNGKNILEIIKNFRAQLYPCIGSVGSPCKVTVNLGQLGFVFIEANVKKLGFCENHNEGSIGAPPLYSPKLMKQDQLLDRGETLPPHYPSDEETFFGPKSLVEKSNLLGKELKKPVRQASSSNAIVTVSDRIGTVVTPDSILKDSAVSGLNKESGNTTPRSDPPSYRSNEKKSNPSPEPEEITLDSEEYERAINKPLLSHPKFGSLSTENDIVTQGSSAAQLQRLELLKKKQQNSAQLSDQGPASDSTTTPLPPITSKVSVSEILSQSSSDSTIHQASSSPSPEPLSSSTPSPKLGSSSGPNSRSGKGSKKKKQAKKGKKKGKKNRTTF